MAKIEKFEDIQAWKKARILTGKIYGITRKTSFAADRSLIDQLRRAAVSTMANIAEGFGRRSNKEFANFLNMSHGSVAEIQCHLYVAHDMAYIKTEDFDSLYTEAEEVSRMIQGFMKYLRC